MADLANQIKEIETLLSSNAREDKSFAYSTLLHLQEQSTGDPSTIEALTERSHRLLSLTISDISDDDEEIASGALKCLGFMIYLPSIVAAVQEDVANSVVESLVKLVTTTKMKAVCNLGVWCISIQQFSASFLAFHFHSLLRAIIHAIDNPIGSLSTTFEAIQAVMKLATQLGEKMRDSSNIWAPPIYRRLISIDKRERDMSERCLLKLKSIIVPPPPSLSKALVVDIKQKLLPGMKVMLLDQGMKVHIIQAWGWFISLLGSQAMKNRQLVNEMLKIPEQTFSDPDPQVQIASQVAWEGLVDALIYPPIQAPGMNTTLGHGIQQVDSVSSDASKGHSSENQAKIFSRSIKLIMTPLVGIMSSKCDVSVHSSCLNTWFYLLHKLDHSVNCPSVLQTVLEPILKVVFQTGPHSKNIWFWNSCLDLLDDFISAKRGEGDNDLKNQLSCHLSTGATMLGSPTGGKCLWKKYPIKWLPWDLNMLDFHLKIIHFLISPESMATVTPENISLACDAALKMFISILKGVQIELKKSSINYKEIMLCLDTILRFTKRVCEELTSKNINSKDLLCTSLRFAEAVKEDIESSLLVSPLYKVALDLKYINELQSVEDIEYANIQGIRSIAYMDMVSPMVYLTMLHLCAVAQSISNESKMEIILHGMQNFVKFILSSYDPMENLHGITSFLHKHRGFIWLKIWIVIAKGLNAHLDCVKDLSLSTMESSSTGYVAICWLLSYPFVVCSFPLKLSNPVKANCSLELCQVSSHCELELEHVIETWKSLYGSVNCALQSECSTTNGFAEDLCVTLTRVFNENTSMIEAGSELHSNDKNQNFILPLFGEATICVLKKMRVLENVGLRSKGSKKKEDGDYNQSSGFKTSLQFVASFLRLSWTITTTDLQSDHTVTSRVFSALACFVGHLHLKQDILLLVEISSDALVPWLSAGKMPEGSTSSHLQIFWTEILNCLQRTQPPIVFDSSVLKVLASLLEMTLDHPNSTISEPTIVFWNSTYGNQIKLDYPQSLLPVLDKLSRSGRISLYKGSPPFLVNSRFRVEAVGALQRCRVAATQKRSSKRVEFMEGYGNDDFDYGDYPSPGLKRKRLELTEHQKEVRRAQQGRERDCNGHGPGVRTYTSIDFSQGNEDSQESQELRNSESILEMLRRAG